MIQYVSTKRRDPRDSSNPQKYYACASSRGTVDLRGIARKISAQSTLTTVDTFAVLEAFIQLIPQELADGKIVQLGEFGSFRVTLRSEGADTAEELNSHAIKEVMVRFRQGTEFKRLFSNPTFEKAS